MKVVSASFLLAIFLFPFKSIAQPIPILAEADASVRFNTGCPARQTTNISTATTLQTMEWTWVAVDCAQGTIRTLLSFDLNLPPYNRRLYDNRARLLMFFTTGSSETHWFAGAATDNRYFIERVT